MPTQVFRVQSESEDESAISALARASALPKARLKDAMNKGAVWLKRGSKTKRMRRATQVLRSSDELILYYNPEVLALHAPSALLLADEKHYSVWIKPAGLLAQGTQEGDHCSLLRQAELAFKREVFLVHRLDREAAGLMLIAHSQKAAAALSALFAAKDGAGAIRKLYRVQVRGRTAENGEITLPLDEKQALTRYTKVTYTSEQDSSLLEVELVTGRKHQIRRHFAESGHPVLGDPVYGENNADPRGLQLFAVALQFTCPLTRQVRHYQWQQG